MKYDGPENLEDLIETENVESILEEIDAIWSALDGQEKDISNDFPQIYAIFKSEITSIEPEPSPIEEKATHIEPLTIHSNEASKKQSLQDLSFESIDEPNQKLQDIDHIVLLEIDLLKKKHLKITDEALLQYTELNTTELAASKIRLEDQGFLIGSNGDCWHRFTQKGKECIDKLKLEAESPIKRLKYSSVPVEFATVEPELMPVKPLTTYFHENVKRQRRQSPFCQSMMESNRIEQDIDDKVLLKIDFLRYQHKAITNTNILFDLGLSDSDLDASKKRLINNGYIKGDEAVFWHSFTKKAKERVEQLKSDQAPPKSKAKYL